MRFVLEEAREERDRTAASLAEHQRDCVRLLNSNLDDAEITDCTVENLDEEW